LAAMDDEKLAAVRVRSRVGHGDDAPGVAQAYRLVIELIAGASRPRTSGVARLHHEVSDDAMEGHTVVVAFTGQEHKVIHRRGGVLYQQLDDQVALARPQRGAVALAGVDRHGRRSIPLLALAATAKQRWDPGRQRGKRANR